MADVVNVARLMAIVVLLGVTVAAQRPTDPALMVPQVAPAMRYHAVPNALTLPSGKVMGAPASVAFDASGHLLVLTRGPESFFEFDRSGKFVRAFGAGLFTRTHGLRIDRAGNLWATDVGAHTVRKFDRQGKVLLTLGTPGEAGEWNEAAGSRKLNQPTDIAFASNGDIFVSQGHTPGADGDARVLKFDAGGRFLKSWGGKGAGPGQFQVAHGLAFDGQGRLWVMDRENQRIQVFTQDGAFVRQMHYAGLPCSLVFAGRSAYLANGYAGQILQLDADGNVQSAIGKSGEGLGEFGEAHFVALGPAGDIYVADSVNGTLTRFVRN